MNPDQLVAAHEEAQAVERQTWQEYQAAIKVREAAYEAYIQASKAASQLSDVWDQALQTSIAACSARYNINIGGTA